MNNHLPNFTAIDIKNFPALLSQKLTHNREFIESLLAQPQYTWDNLMQPLEQCEDALHQFFSPLSHLNAVTNTTEIRASYQACLPLLSEYHTDLGQHEKLYQAVRTLKENSEYAKLNATQQCIIDHTLLDFKLSGIALDPAQKQCFKDIQQQLTKLTNHFENNLLDATNAWQKHITDQQQLAGVPQHALATAAQLATEKQLPGWLLTLEFPCYYAIITYADDRKLREEIYHAYVTRASDLDPHAGQWDNSSIMQQILQLRHEEACLLGYHNYAELSLAKKMAQSTQQVLDFLTDLAQRAKSQAQQEFNQLSQFAKTHCNLTTLQPWDISYVSEKLRQAQYAISQETLRPYFPQPTVLAGMFTIAEKLYGIHITPVTGVSTWHPDVVFYQIHDQQGNLRGQLYLDLYARPHKRSGAWMDDCVGRRRLTNGEIQIPVAFLTCNFAPPTAAQPAIFSHDEVETLFHEFGHCLHHLLTKVDYSSASGISGVEWDAVELPSQFFENWCWEREALHLISRHYLDGSPLPESLFNSLKQAKNFQAAMQLLRQVEFSLFDFKIHLEYDPAKGARVQEILDHIRHQISVVPIAPYNRFQHSFSHIFAGGYAAGYYSYKWAEVLSSDAFSKFEEHGIFDRKTGEEFLKCILEVGGSRPALQSFIAFRGREPKIDALLRHSGIHS